MNDYYTPFDDLCDYLKEKEMNSWRSNYKPETFICRLSTEEIDLIIESLYLMMDEAEEKDLKLDALMIKELMDQFLFLKKV